MARQRRLTATEQNLTDELNKALSEQSQATSRLEIANARVRALRDALDVVKANRPTRTRKPTVKPAASA